MTARSAPSDGAPALVLVVDDNPTNRYVLGTHLRRAGHRVMEAEDGTGALTALRDARELPETAVVDVRLPDMTGFEVCEAIKAEPRTAALPVIHISASAISVTDRAQGLNRGADAYLTEPVAPNELLATVAAALRYARARRQAETLATQLRELNQVTLDFYRAQDATALAARTALGASRMFSATAGVVVRTPEDGPVQALITRAGETVAAGRSADFAREVLRRQARGKAGVRMEVVSAADLRAPQPLAAEGRRLVVASAQVKRAGAAACVVLPQEALSSDSHDVLTQLAHACVLSLETQRSYRAERDLALTLQRTFLPGSLPATPLADLAVRYMPASQTAEIGGDFYEALVVDDGLLLAVGDVAGHSLDAAVVMGGLRHALRAYALEGHPPHEILNRLDRLLHRVNAPMGATVCVVLIDGRSGTAHVANAGHLPPLLCDPVGGARFELRHGPMLGLGLPHPPAVPVAVPPGTGIVMITDGLVERRGTDLDVELTRMERALAGSPRDPAAMCDLLLRQFPPDGNDDIALMAARIL